MTLLLSFVLLLSGVLKNIEKKYSTVEAVEGVFYEKHEPGGTQWKGRFVMEKGGKLLWIYEKPKGKRVVSDGRRIYYFIDSEKKVLYRELKREPSGLFFVWDKKKLEKYDITVNENSYIVVTLRPKNGRGEFDRADLVFSRNDYRLISVTIRDELGNTSIVVFKKWKVVKKPPDYLFRVKIPKDYKVQRID